MARTRALKCFAVAMMALASVVLGHELTYLLAHGTSGYSAAMQDGGHERYWTTLVVAIGSVGAALVVAITIQLSRLRRLTVGIKAGSLVIDDGGPLLTEIIRRLWMRVAAAALGTYMLQENLETLTSSGEVPGLGVLLGDHIIALPLLLLASLLVSLVGALAWWRRELMLRRLGAQPRAWLRATSFPVPTDSTERQFLFAGNANSCRAPPAPLPGPA